MIRVLLELVYVVVAMFAEGFTLMILWGWFAVPLGAVELNLFMAMGVLLLVWFTAPSGVKAERFNLAERASILVLKVPVFLLVGWLVQLCL